MLSLNFDMHQHPVLDTGVVEGFRSAFLGRAFDVLGLGISFIIGTMAFLAGVWHFNRVERRFADII